MAGDGGEELGAASICSVGNKQTVLHFFKGLYLNILATLVQTSLSFIRFSNIRQSSGIASESRSLHLD